MVRWCLMGVNNCCENAGRPSSKDADRRFSCPHVQNQEGRQAPQAEEGSNLDDFVI